MRLYLRWEKKEKEKENKIIKLRAHWPKACTLGEDQSLGSGTHIRWLKIPCNTSSRGYNVSVGTQIPHKNKDTYLKIK